MPLLPKALAGVDTPCLAGTSAQHIQGEPSQISLCYFKPTKDAGPLPRSHKYLCSRARPELNQPAWRTRLTAGGGGGQQSPAGQEHGETEPAPQREAHSGAHMAVFRVGKLRLKAHKVMHGTLPPLQTQVLHWGLTRVLWYLGQQSVHLLKSRTKSPLWGHTCILWKETP